jgi:uncharacterized protein (TIGR02147 family)
MIFSYTDYAKYLINYMSNLPGKGRGFKARIAGALKCKSSYVSQIFARSAVLSQEQAFSLNTLLQHGELEAKYFLLLVQFARAGTTELKEHYKSEIKKMQAESMRLKNRFEFGSLESKVDEFKYFSTAEHALVHVLTTIPAYQNKAAMLKKLKITPTRLEVILTDLLKWNLLQTKGDRYTPGVERIHLPDDAPIISTHHINWRVEAMKNCKTPSEHDLHYSSAVSVSEKDFRKIRENLTKAIEDTRNTIKESNSEILCSFNLDYFEIK